MRPVLITLSLSLLVNVAVAQGAPDKAPHAVVVQPDKVSWGQGPASLPAGAKAAVLEGDPKQAGPFTMRLSFPDGYRIPAHSHPAIERVTVIPPCSQAPTTLPRRRGTRSFRSTRPARGSSLT
jgi:hypothetical protein